MSITAKGFSNVFLGGSGHVQGLIGAVTGRAVAGQILYPPPWVSNSRTAHWTALGVFIR